MVYMGSKRRIALNILYVVLKDRKEGQTYVEPFIGGANIFDKVKNPRIGSDCNKYTIGALKIIRDSPEKLPQSFTEEEYLAIKEDKHNELYDFRLRGWIGYIASFGAKFYGGYARNEKSKKNPMHYIERGYRNAIKQSPQLKGCSLIHSDYRNLTIPPRSIIYCDPPYFGTTEYKYAEGFDSEEFWEWCREKTREGHRVYISEYSAPEDFKVLLDFPALKNNLQTGQREKLFTYEIVDNED